MRSISALIEHYLKELLESSDSGYIEIQRNELAQRFRCVPSQINYVLSTRFRLEHGYVVESRRGGGGYIRIVKVPASQELGLVQELCEYIGEAIAEQPAYRIVDRLVREGLLTRREGKIIKAALSRQVLRLGLPARDQLRAYILKQILQAVLQDEPRDGGE